MMVLHGLQVLYFALLEMRISLVSASMTHHHLVMCTRHVILTIVIRVMIRVLLCITIIVVHVILLLMHVLLLMSKVLLLLLHRLSDNSLSVEIHGQVLETLDFEL